TQSLKAVAVDADRGRTDEVGRGTWGRYVVLGPARVHVFGPEIEAAGNHLPIGGARERVVALLDVAPPRAVSAEESIGIDGSVVRAAGQHIAGVEVRAAAAARRLELAILVLVRGHQLECRIEYGGDRDTGVPAVVAAQPERIEDVVGIIVP